MKEIFRNLEIVSEEIFKGTFFFRLYRERSFRGEKH
jgi:hypothetical protein